MNVVGRALLVLGGSEVNVVGRALLVLGGSEVNLVGRALLVLGGSEVNVVGRALLVLGGSEVNLVGSDWLSVIKLDWSGITRKTINKTDSVAINDNVNTVLPATRKKFDI